MYQKKRFLKPEQIGVNKNRGAETKLPFFWTSCSRFRFYFIQKKTNKNKLSLSSSQVYLLETQGNFKIDSFQLELLNFNMSN